MLGKPIYIPSFAESLSLETLLEEIPWENRTAARKECFMSDGGGVSYTYGEGPGARTYTSIPSVATVLDLQEKLNSFLEAWGSMNGCFLNLYEGYKNALGWHADDFPGMDHTRPVCVISVGEEREIWWRPNGQRGTVPLDQRQLLASGSLFVMPPGFQHTHEHRIPKGSRQDMTSRVSLTFRAFSG